MIYRTSSVVHNIPQGRYFINNLSGYEVQVYMYFFYILNEDPPKKIKVFLFFFLFILTPPSYIHECWVCFNHHLCLFLSVSSPVPLDTSLVKQVLTRVSKSCMCVTVAQSVATRVTSYQSGVVVLPTVATPQVQHKT